MDDKVLAYLAGFFDGEGHVSIMVHAASQRLRVGVANTDVRPLCLFKETLSGNICAPKRRKEHYKQPYEWYASSQDAMKAMSALLPFLIVKRELAETGIAFERLRSKHYELYGNGGHPDEAWAEREAIRERILALNGHPVGEGKHRNRTIQKYTTDDVKRLKAQGADKTRHIRARLLEPGRESQRFDYLKLHRESERRRREKKKALYVVSAPLAQEAC